MAVQEFASLHGSPAAAQIAYLRYWSEWRLGPNVTHDDLQRGAIPLLLLEPAQPQELLLLIQADLDKIFILNPPMDRPDPGALALMFRADPLQLLPLMDEPLGGFSELQQQVVDEAIALLFARKANDLNLPLALRMSDPLDPAVADQLQTKWIDRVTQEVTRQQPDLQRDPNALPLTEYAFSRPIEPANFMQLHMLYSALPDDPIVAQHPGLQATTILWCQGLAWAVPKSASAVLIAQTALSVMEGIYGANPPAEVATAMEQLRMELGKQFM